MTGFRGKPLRGNRDQISAQATMLERAETHTNLPGEIVDFDKDKQEATIKVLHVPRLNGKETPMPELKKVPVVFDRGGGDKGGALTWPLKKGDPVEVHFAERNIEKWYTEGGAQPAATNRMHDLSDAIAVPGKMRSEKQKLEGFSDSHNELRSLTSNGYPKVRYNDQEMRVEFNQQIWALLNQEKIRLEFDEENFIEITAEGIKIVGKRVDIN